ncbi:MAG TPA: hypothetical protein DC054_23480 [Blastocatellia bacterium]|nr:hypothetical protein [Blastocatellia bacterium]
MIRKLSLVVALIAATCFAGLVFSGSSAINDTASAMTLGQNNNREMNRGDRHNRRRNNRRWHRRGRRHNRRGNRNKNSR